MDIENAAYHRAGQTIAALLGGVNFQYVSIAPDLDEEGELSLKSLWYHWDTLDWSSRRWRREKAILYFHIGFAGQQVSGRPVNSPSKKTEERVLELAGEVIGQTSPAAPKKLRKADKKLTAAYNNYQRAYAEHFIEAHKPAVEHIAKGLMAHKRLTFQWVHAALGGVFPSLVNAYTLAG